MFQNQVANASGLAKDLASAKSSKNSKSSKVSSSNLSQGIAEKVNGDDGESKEANDEQGGEEGGGNEGASADEEDKKCTIM